MLKSSRLPRYLAAFSMPLLVSILYTAPLGADDRDSDAGLRAYFALPFGEHTKQTPSRVGVQLLTSFDEDGSRILWKMDAGSHLDTAVDLAFSRRGLAKFEIMGADARDTWHAAASVLFGIETNVPEECETTTLCQPGKLLLAGGDVAAQADAAKTHPGSVSGPKP